MRPFGKQVQKCVAGLILGGLAAVAVADGPRRTTALSKTLLVVSLPADVQKLDPPAPTDGNSMIAVAHIFDRLVEFHETTTEVVPSLAKSWDVSDDRLRWTFHLRDDVTFSDGTKFTSEAVKFSLERINDTTHPQHFPGIAWADELLGDWFSHIETPDPQTAVVVLHRPFTPLLQALAIPPASIVSPDHWRKTGEAVVSNPVGTGAYVLDEWKRGAYLKMTARKDYWGNHGASETIFLQAQPDPNQSLSALRTGDVHCVVVVKPQAVRDPSRLGKGTLIEMTIPSLGYATINTKKPGLDDVRVRQAMNYAINRDNYCEVLLEGTSIPAKGILPPGMLGFSEDRPFSYTHDPEKARKLMAEAGYSAEKPLKFEFACFEEIRPYNTAGSRLAARMASDLKECFMEPTIRQMDFRGFIEYTDQRTEHQVGTIGWMSDTGDPDNFIYYLFGTPTNRSNYDAGEARAWMEEAQSELDPAKRAELYQRAEEKVLQDAPAIFINHAKWVKGVSKDLKGFVQHSVMVDRFHNSYVK